MRQMTDLRVDHPVVEAIGKMNFTGNIIPNAWFQTLRDKSGHPYMNAIVILADIRYWYTPTEVRDEESGRTIGYRKKFAADALQRSRNKFAEQFGLSLKQVDAALNYLDDCGIIHKEIRNGVFNGRKVGNVMYIYLDADVLYQYTYPESFSLEESVEEELLKEGDDKEKVLFETEDSLKEGKKTTMQEEESVTLQGERVAPALHREREYCPIGGEGIPLQGERVSPYREKECYPKGGEGITLREDTNTYIKTKNNTNNTYPHHQSSDEEYVKKVFSELCRDIKGVRMREESKCALCARIKEHPDIDKDIIMLAAGFSASTCLFKVPLSRIKYLSAVLFTLEELQINTSDQFKRFQREWREHKGRKNQKSQQNYTESFQREYDFEELERKLLSNNN